MSIIEFDNVTLDYPIFDSTNLSLRNKLVSIATGGFLKTTDKLTVVRALDHVSFKIKEGDSVGLIGHNGAGKSTLLRTMAGIYKPQLGNVKIIGDISTVFELGSGLDHDVDGVQNIINLCLIKGMTLGEARGLLENIAEFTELGDFLYLPVRTYSSGMLLRLMFAVATIKAPDIFLLDEMFSTGDAEFQKKSMRRINEIIDKSKIFVFASHDHGLLKAYCNRVFRLEHGKVVEISVSELA